MQHYISLGYFCSVASELEYLGLRSESSPFDWLISDFEGIISAIRNHFKDFLSYEYLAQNKQYPAYYLNTKYKIQFYHDFSPYRSLKEQLPLVQEKYLRRIERFYVSICEPTLFIRYISDEQPENGSSKELLWIEEHYDEIIALLKSFNEKNEILFIANEGIKSSIIEIQYVQKDKNDSVNRRPIVSTPSLLQLFNSFEYTQKEVNLLRYKKKRACRTIFKIKKKTAAYFQKFFMHEYVHGHQY